MYDLIVSRLPKHLELMPSVANGHLGTTLYNAEVYMNGLYNGAHGDSHRAIIPSTCSINITGTVPHSHCDRTYTLNVGEGNLQDE